MNKSRTDAWFAREIEAAEPALFRVAFAILRNRPDCEDAAQSAVLKAYRHLDTLSERKYFRTSWKPVFYLHVRGRTPMTPSENPVCSDNHPG